MDHISIKAYVCVYCHEQVEGYDDYDGRPHYHDGKDWPVYEVELSAETFDGSLTEVLDQKREEFELELENAARLSRERTVRDRYRTLVWLSTAPNKQVEEWRKSLKRSAKTVEAFHNIMKDSYLPEIREQLNRQIYGTFWPDPRTPYEQARAEAYQLWDDIQRQKETITRFHKYGLAKISLWQLDNAQERLQELRGRIPEVLKSVSHNKRGQDGEGEKRP